MSRGGPCVHRVPLAACGDRPWGQDRSRESREEEVMMDRTRVGTVMGLGEIRLWNDSGGRAKRIFSHSVFWGIL